MPKASKETASDSMQMEGYEGHYENFDGGYTVAFETYSADADPGELFKGLPDDRCQSSHWGYVFKGKVTFKYADREEVYEAGDAYYAPPGHIPVVTEGTEMVEFSPSEEYGLTMEVVTRNLAAMQAS